MATSVPPTFAEKDLNYYLRMIRGDFAELEETQAVKVGGPSSQKNIVLLLGSSCLGSGHDELGKKIMLQFLSALSSNRVKPRAIILVNSAIHLAVEGSEAVGRLMLLEEQGTRIMACVSSVDELAEEAKLAVGHIADMDAIADHLLQAWKVISL